MLKTNVSFSTRRPSSLKHYFVISVSKLLNVRYKERCWLLSMPLKNDWLHFGIWLGIAISGSRIPGPRSSSPIPIP